MTKKNRHMSSWRLLACLALILLAACTSSAYNGANVAVGGTPPPRPLATVPTSTYASNPADLEHGSPDWIAAPGARYLPPRQFPQWDPPR